MGKGPLDGVIRKGMLLKLKTAERINTKCDLNKIPNVETTQRKTKEEIFPEIT